MTQTKRERAEAYADIVRKRDHLAELLDALAVERDNFPVPGHDYSAEEVRLRATLAEGDEVIAKWRSTLD